LHRLLAPTHPPRQLTLAGGGSLSRCTALAMPSGGRSCCLFCPHQAVPREPVTRHKVLPLNPDAWFCRAIPLVLSGRWMWATPESAFLSFACGRDVFANNHYDAHLV